MIGLLESCSLFFVVWTLLHGLLAMSKKDRGLRSGAEVDPIVVVDAKLQALNLIWTPLGVVDALTHVVIYVLPGEQKVIDKLQ